MVTSGLLGRIGAGTPAANASGPPTMAPERALDEPVPQWIAADWSFRQPRYPGRDITWQNWLALRPALSDGLATASPLRWLDLSHPGTG